MSLLSSLYIPLVHSIEFEQVGRVVKNKLGARAGKYKIGVQGGAGKYKLRARAGCQGQGRGRSKGSVAAKYKDPKSSRSFISVTNFIKEVRNL